MRFSDNTHCTACNVFRIKQTNLWISCYNMTEYKDLPTADLMNVFITSNIESFTTSEKRFDKSITVSDLKSKLEEMIPGGSALTMKITVFDKEAEMICILDNDHALFGSYPVEPGYRLYISEVEGDYENMGMGFKSLKFFHCNEKSTKAIIGVLQSLSEKISRIPLTVEGENPTTRLWIHPKNNLYRFLGNPF